MEGETRPRPYPGDELVLRVAGHADREYWESSGRASVEALERALALTGRSLADFERILDFGCGPGRMALWLEDVARTAELHGCDVDERAIGWARRNIPWGTFAVNGAAPPLAYEDGFFDLVYNHSVFTHLDEELQDRWLTELHRVTHPGATLLLTVNGEAGFRGFENDVRDGGGDPGPVRERLERDGIVFLTEDSWLGSAHSDHYHTTFHAPWYVLEHWGWFFEVRAYLPRHALGLQDMLVLERRDAPLPPTVPTRPRRMPAAAAGPSAVAAPVEPGVVDPAVAHAIWVLEHWPSPDMPSPRGPLATLARRIVLRALKPYTHHQAELNRAVVEALRAGSSFGDAHAIAVSVRDGLLRQGQRITRLELELLERLEALEGRGDRES